MSFRNYLEKVEVFSTNRDLQKYVEIGEKMLTIDIEKLPSYNRVFTKGIQEGLQKGIDKGKHEAMKVSVKALKSLGQNEEQIATMLNLSYQEVLELLK